MRIGFFTDSYLPALHGVEVSIEAFRRSLQKAGHKVFVYAPATPDDRDRNRAVFRFKSIRVIEKPEMRLAFPLVEHGHLRDVVHVRLDIAHVHTPFTVGLLGKVISVQQHIPVVYTHHTDYPEYAKAYLKERFIAPRLAQALSAWFSNISDAVIAPSPKIKTLLKAYGVKRPIYVLPTGVRLRQFRKTRQSQAKARALRKRLHIHPAAKVLLFVGRMGTEKNVACLLRAFAELRKERTNVAFVLVGDGPILDKLKAIAHRLALDHAIFVGQVPHRDIAVYYQAADLFVFSSLTDTQGLVILEAMASGLAVAALKDDAFKGMIIDGKNGLLIDPRASPRHFAARTGALLDNRTRWRRFSRMSARIARGFSEEEQAKKLIRLYESLISRREP